MKVFREIAFSRYEPPKSFIWVGFTDDGDYFIRIWNNGWVDLGSNSGGGGSDVNIKSGDGISISARGDTYTISINNDLYKNIEDVISFVNDLSIGTAKDVDEICK